MYIVCLIVFFVVSWLLKKVGIIIIKETKKKSFASVFLWAYCSPLFSFSIHNLVPMDAAQCLTFPFYIVVCSV